MARATTAPVPVMTKRDVGSAGKGSGVRGAATAKAATATKSARKAKRVLGGAWGASFEGRNADGSPVKG